MRAYLFVWQVISGPLKADIKSVFLLPNKHTMKYNNLYIGKLIEQICEEKKVNITQFAENIRCSRGNVYLIFKAKSIDTDKLILISEVLGYGFLEEYLPEKSKTSNQGVVLDTELNDK